MMIADGSGTHPTTPETTMQTLARMRHLALPALALAVHTSSALAINGAQPGGYGVNNAAMGGASIALPLDAVAAANNPAGLGALAPSATLGLQVFRGRSSANYVMPGNALHNTQTALAPEGGFLWRQDETWAFGLSVAGSGVGSNYKQAALPVPGAEQAKTRLQVLEMVPAAAWTPRPGLTLGLGLNLAVERFDTQGAIVPAPVQGGLLPVPGHGAQTASGVGLRAGLLWQATPDWRLGLSLKSRTRMGRLSGYDQDLLSYSHGRLDVPAQFGLGAAWQAHPRVTLAADALRILWGDIQAMKDPAGFGWHNQTVLRLGAAWQLDDRWTLRAGASRNSGQIDSSRTVQNLLVPSIHRRAVTLGASWQAGPRDEVNLGVEHNPRTTLSGSGPSAGTDLTSKVQMVLLGLHHRF
jgi:long-chain fatty acid transport protein